MLYWKSTIWNFKYKLFNCLGDGITPCKRYDPRDTNKTCPIPIFFYQLSLLNSISNDVRLWGGGGGACRNVIYAMREKSAILPYIDTKDGFKIWKVVGKWILIICLKFTVQQLVSRVTDKHTLRIYTNVKVQTSLNKH